MSDSDPVPVFRASSAAVGGAAALELFRESVRDVFEVAPVGTAPADFRLDMIATHLGRVLISDVRAAALRFRRDQELIASAGVDHLLVQLYISGGYTGVAGSREIQVRAGDICILDLLQTLETEASDFGNITLVVPRALLADTATNTNGLHGVVLRREQPLTGILAAHLRSLIEQAGQLSAAEAEIAGRGTVALIAHLVDGLGNSEPVRVTVTPLRHILDYIDANLHDPTLAPGRIMQRFSLSRAKMYRMFESAGGVAEVIRLRRLNGAALELASATAEERRISEVARSWGFADDSSFGRAFRAHYGITPTDARTRSTEIWSKIQSWRTDTSGEAGAEISFWLRRLRP